jgi:hypothetical protein
LFSREVDGYTKSLLSDSDITGIGAASLLESTEGCDSDLMIARMLQMQFDKEHDETLKRTEAKYNGTSKGILNRAYHVWDKRVMQLNLK